MLIEQILSILKSFLHLNFHPSDFSDCSRARLGVLCSFVPNHVTLSRKDWALVGVGWPMDWSIPGKTTDQVLCDGCLMH